MPVYKYRSVNEMPPPGQGGNRSLAERIRALWNRAFLLSPPRFPRGVTRFRSIDEANVKREADTRERMAAAADRE